MNDTTALKPFKTIHVAFRQCCVMTVLVTIVLFITFGFIGACSVMKNALESYIAERFSVTVFLKPGVSPDKASIERLQALPEINEIKLVPPATALRFINRHTDINIDMLAKGISPELFPFTLVIQFHKQYLGKVPEVITTLTKEMPDIQEVRYPAAALKESLQNIQTLDALTGQLTLLMGVVAVAGCLSVLALVVQNRQFWFQYSLSGLVASAAASLLLFLTCAMLSSVSGWQILFPEGLYCPVIFTGLLAGITGDLCARFQRSLNDNTLILKGERCNGDGNSSPPLQEVST